MSIWNRLTGKQPSGGASTAVNPAFAYIADATGGGSSALAPSAHQDAAQLAVKEAANANAAPQMEALKRGTQSHSSAKTQVTSVGDLPKSIGMSKDVPASLRTRIGVLLLEHPSVCVVVTQDTVDSPIYISIKRDLATRGLVIVHTYIAKNSALLQEIYKVHDVQPKALVKQTRELTQAEISAGLQVANDILTAAMEAGASDIHYECRDTARGKSGVVRFRVDGDLTVHESYDDPYLLVAAAAALYQSDHTVEGSRSHNFFNPLSMLSAQVRVPIRNADVRLQTAPSEDGFDLVLRLNSYEGRQLSTATLAELGFSQQQQADLMRASSRPHGLSIVNGATGAGKTTTLAAVLEAQSGHSNTKRISIESPVENKISNCTQIPVAIDPTSEDTVRPFVAAMRAVLRMDPDTISAGEMRDEGTGQMAQNMALTGHNTFVTLHSNSAFRAFDRLLDSIKISLEVLSGDGFLNVIMYQTLIPRLCPHCRVPALGSSSLAPARLDLLNQHYRLDTGKLFVTGGKNPDGTPCKHCGGRGYAGRRVAAEVIMVNSKIRDFLSDRRIRDAEMFWRSQRIGREYSSPDTSGTTAFEHAIYLATQGEICTAQLCTRFGDLEDQIDRQQAVLRWAKAHLSSVIPLKPALQEVTS